MKTRSFSALAIVLAAGCAHGQAEGRHTTADAHDAHEHGHKTASHDVESNEPRAVRDEQERVDVPAGGKREGHLASTGESLPEDRPAGAAAYGTEPDNTRVNERDRGSAALTPMDQSESESDRELVQRIRKAVIADDSLSFTAKNVKIITRDGQVTLRGSVNNAREKATLEKTAAAAAGGKRVTNELEVSN